MPDGLWITGDQGQLRQVVLNLVINAAEAMQGRDGGVALTARADAGAVVIEVRDDGIGMDAELQARIFEPYVSTKFTGRGLGLAVVAGIVRGHGGTIAVASEVGVGTTFTVRLPAGARAVAAVAVDETPWRGTGTVLLVDDDAAVRRGVARMLVSLGFEVLAAGDGAEGVAMLTQDPARVDVVIMDQTMPRLDGVAAATAMRALGVTVPIVLISGYGDMPPGAGDVLDAVLAKPFGIDVIRRTLRPLLAGHAPAAA